MKYALGISMALCFLMSALYILEITRPPRKDCVIVNAKELGIGVRVAKASPGNYKVCFENKDRDKK